MMTKLLAFAALVLAAAVVVGSECIQDKEGRLLCSMGKCAQDLYGRVFCIGPGGDIESDDNDKIYCGVGECVADDNDVIFCSKTPGGGAAKDKHGKVKCYGGCTRGSKKLCVLGK